MERRHRYDDVGESAAPARDAVAAQPGGGAKRATQPSALTSLSDDKLARFVIGRQKKTKFEKDREEREARKRRADEEAAQIYAKFVASFENEDETLGKAFVRGETVVQGSADQQQQQSGRDAHQRGEVYRLKPKDNVFSSSASLSAAAAQLSTAASRPPGKKLTEMERMLEEMKQKDVERQLRREQHQAATTSANSSSVGPPPSAKKRREIDQFLDELKEREPVAPTMDEMGLGKGSFDHGDPTTTNLYVGNLAPTVTEEALEALFGKFGDIFSVKIMWPRTEEERARKRNCGFVSFFERCDADDARVSLHDKELDGQPMIVGWSKAVKIDFSVRKAARAAPPAVIAPLVSELKTGVTAAVGSGGEAKAKIEVALPADADVRARIDHLARYVAKDGVQFENAIRMREAAHGGGGNSEFGFLFETQSALATYYRWRVYAFAMGDEDDAWREAPFQMTSDGPIWMPPPIPPSSRKRRRSRSRLRSTGDRLSSRRHENEGSGRSSSRKRRSGSSSDRSSSQSSSRSSSRDRSASPRSRSSRRSASSHRRRSSRSRSRSRGRRGRRDDDDSASGDSRSRSNSRSSSSSSSSPRRRRRSRSRSRGRRGSRRRSRSGSRAHEQEERKRRLERDIQLLTGQQIARAREIERGREKNRLLSAEYDAFKELLASLTLERESVKTTMGFALDHSEAAVDIVSVILKEFKKADVSAVAMVGLLYVASDILHNSSAAVKNASLFRTTFQDCLPEILEHLRLAHKALVGRMSANAMKEKVLTVLTAWESWSLFPPTYLVGLNATFLRKHEEMVQDSGDADGSRKSADTKGSSGADGDIDEERLRKTCRQAGILATGDAKQLLNRLQWLQEFTAPKIAPSSVASSKTAAKAGLKNSAADITASAASAPDGNRADDIDGEPIDDDADREGDGEDIDGESIDGDDENLDGQPLTGEDDDNSVDGEPMDGSEDLDGEPLDENRCEEDVDGAPLDEDEDDLDGEPL